MKLKTHLESEGTTAVEFARRIGVHFTTVYDYMRDEDDARLKRPRAGTLKRIIKATKGAVGAADFYGSAPIRIRSRAQRRA